MSLSVALPALHAAAALTTGGTGAAINGSGGGISALSPTFGVGGDSLPSPTSDRVEWSRSTILDFIEDYRMHRVLWDPNTKGYHIKQTKYEALKLLGNKYGTEIRSIRSKIKSLRSSFHREHGKVMVGRQKGVHYQPMWFAYDAIRFILDGEGGSGGGGSVAARGQHAPSTVVNADADGEADEVEEKLTVLRDDSVDGNGGGGGGGGSAGDDGAERGDAESGEMDDKYATTMEAAVRAIQAAALAGARESGSGGGAVTPGANGAAVAGTTVDELRVEAQATSGTAAGAATNVNVTKTTATTTNVPGAAPLQAQQLPNTVVYGMKAAAAAALVANSKLFNAAGAPMTTTVATPTTTTATAAATSSESQATTSTTTANTHSALPTVASTAATTTIGSVTLLPYGGSKSNNNNNNNINNNNNNKLLANNNKNNNSVGNNLNVSNAMAMMTMATPALKIIGSADWRLATMATASGGGCGATVGGTTMSHAFGATTPLFHAVSNADDEAAVVARLGAAVAAATAAANGNRNVAVAAVIDELQQQQQQQLAAARSTAGAVVADGAGLTLATTNTATDYEADIQSFCCNISADDVKTEIIEGDTGELVMLEQQQQQQQQQHQQQQQQQQQQQSTQHPRSCSVTPLTASAVNYYNLPPMAELPISSSVGGGRKRKLLGLHADIASPSKKNALALQQHLQHQQLHQQQQLHQHQKQAQTQHSNAQAQAIQRDPGVLAAAAAAAAVASARGALAYVAAGQNSNNSSSNNNNSNNNNHGNGINSTGNNNNNNSNNSNNNNLLNLSSHQNPMANTNNNNNSNNNNAASSSGIGSTSSSSSGGNPNNNHNNNTNNTPNDEYGVFGEYVAITIRKLKTPKAKIVIKHLINNLLYEAEMGKYDHGMPSSKEPPQLYKM